jgi:hypothetical protein
LAPTPHDTYLKVAPLHRLDAELPLRRMEDKIRVLCAQLLAASDDYDGLRLTVALRDELHEHIERLRAKLVHYPVLIERRKYSSAEVGLPTLDTKPPSARIKIEPKESEI